YLAIIANKLAAASEQKVLAFGGLQDQRYPVFLCFRICNTLSLKLIHQITEFHHITHDYRLLTCSDNNMTFPRLNGDINSQHFSKIRTPSSCPISDFGCLYRSIICLNRKTLIFFANISPLCVSMAAEPIVLGMIA